MFWSSPPVPSKQDVSDDVQVPPVSGSPAPRTQGARRRDARRPAAGAEPRERTGRHPDYVIEIAINPQLRERDPGRPLTLLEALQAGHPPAPPGQPAPEPEPPGLRALVLPQDGFLDVAVPAGCVGVLGSDDLEA